MRPTGRLHLGNYMGALYNWVKLQQDYECYFFIADLHALTTDYADPSRLKQNVFDIALDFLAAGINPGKTTLFVQSHVPQHAELHLLFSMITPLGWLERVPTYKDQQAQLTEKELNTYGFLGYPLLQSADILLYKPLYVPVGADQVAHVELTREVARRFNTFYSPKRIVPGVGSPSANLGYIATEPDPDQLLLPEPDVLLTASPKLPGLDGRKMSKSYGNAIYLTDDIATVQRKMHSMTNGGQRPTQDTPGDPDICPVGDLHAVFSWPEMDAQIREGCRSARLRCDQCKFMAATSITEKLQPMQAHRRDLQGRPKAVWDTLENGAVRAAKVAEGTMLEIRNAVGLSRDLSGVRSEASLSSIERTKDVRDLSAMESWWNAEPPVFARNVREAWHREILSSEIALKPEGAEGVWLTQNNRRVLAGVSQVYDVENVWHFTVKAKSYEVLVLLCLDRERFLHDFVVPQKMYIGAWTLAKRAAKDGLIRFHVALEEEGICKLYIGDDPVGVDITATEHNYVVIER
jgi:tryptophanyl-tRNA synthetase